MSRDLQRTARRVPSLSLWLRRLAFGSLALGLVSPAPPAEPDGRYRGAEVIFLGSSQNVIRAADVNADGAEDVFFLLASGELVGFISRPQGFEKTTILTALESGFSIAAGRIDGDAFADLAVSARGGVRVLLGNGDGTFRQVALLPAMFFAGQVGIVRANEDQHSDVVLADSNAGLIRTFFGDGTGGFSAPADQLAGGEPHGFDVADFDRDGRLDVVVALGNDNLLSILFGKEGGGFGPPRPLELGRNSSFVAARDFSGDGNLDLASADPRSSELIILLGKGGAEFSAPQAIPTVSGAGDLLSEDINGDGLPDVLVVGERSLGGRKEYCLAVHTGVSGGTVREAVFFPVGGGPSAIATCDWNLDGFRDVLVGNQSASFASALLGEGRGVLRAPRTLELEREPTRLVAQDMDGDARLDFVVALKDFGGFAMLLSDPSGEYRRVSVPDLAVPEDILVAKVTADDLPDVVVTSIAGGVEGVTVFPGRGDGTFDAPRTTAAGALPHAVVAGDLNGDGFMDLVVGNPFSDKVTVLLGLGNARFELFRSLWVGEKPSAIALADCNRDGFLDILTANRASSDFSSVINDLPFSFYPEDRFPASGEPAAILSADLDGDERADAALLDSANAALLVFSGTSSCKFDPLSSVPTGLQPAAFAAAPRGATGPVDIAVACQVENTVRIYENDGRGNFSNALAYETGSAPVALVWADLDGDGLRDIATADYASARITILYGTTKPEPPVETFRRGRTNGDDRLDLSDAVSLLAHLFLGGAIVECPDAADSNDDGQVNISDGIYTLTYLFLGGAEPPAPGPEACGPDPTPDGLGPCPAPCL